MEGDDKKAWKELREIVDNVGRSDKKVNLTMNKYHKKEKILGKNHIKMKDQST